MKLVVTIDTEEDNWGIFHPTQYSVTNIEHIPELQRLLSGFGVRPTYLMDYPVATNPKSLEMFKRLLETGQCEIGTQCHPWNTPPFEERPGERNTMLCNLPPKLQFLKLQSLHETLVKNLGVTPTSFRAGRWGYSGEVAESIEKLGYTVDTSITAYTDWSHEFGPDFSSIAPEPYYFGPENIFTPKPGGRMLEIPATIGFTQTTHHWANRFFGALKRRPIRRLRLAGVLAGLGLLNQVWLSPEKCTSDEMIALARRLMLTGSPIINLFFHSPSLQPGLTPYVRTPSDRQTFFNRLSEFLSFAKESGIKPIALSDAWREVPR